MKTSELTGAALDWAVIQAEHGDANTLAFIGENRPRISESWATCGPIIEREKIATSPLPDGSWRAYAPMGTRVLNALKIFNWQHKGNGLTPLIAAMRCFVASRLGDDVEIPNELQGE